MIIQYTHETPVSNLTLVADDDALLQLLLPNAVPGDHPEGRNAIIDLAIAQLDEYFAGKRFCFDLPLALHGTAFQEKVWQAVSEIPYGETASYADIAAAIERPRAVRAVGAANGANPIPLIIPCHRIIGKSGNLVGYGGGLELKRCLLDLEAKYTNSDTAPR